MRVLAATDTTTDSYYLLLTDLRLETHTYAVFAISTTLQCSNTKAILFFRIIQWYMEFLWR